MGEDESYEVGKCLDMNRWYLCHSIESGLLSEDDYSLRGRFGEQGEEIGYPERVDRIG